MYNDEITDEQIEVFVPGRLCLFGEHSDWAGTNKSFNANIVPGMAIVTGTEQGIYATAKKSDRFKIYSSLEQYQGDRLDCEMNPAKLRETARDGGFFSYVAGVASYMCEWYHVSGVEIQITKMDLPMKSGLSSSAAICVLVAKVFSKLYQLHLNTLGIMNIAYWGEQRTPSRCGRLDQACAFGSTPVIMTFDGNELDAHRITVREPLYYVFADLMAGKDTIKILSDLNRAYPFPHNEMEERLHEALGKENQAIIKRALKYISEGNPKALGALMTEAQELFDSKIAPMCPEELTAPVLHKTLADENIKELVFGGKGVGSQGDGTIQFLAKDKECQDKLIKYLTEVLGMTSYPLTIKPKAAVRKAVIPVAGFGTRLYPETRGVKKEFCPVVDRDGLVKPGILVLLEELDSIGIEEICIILNREEQSYYEDFFFKPISDTHFNKLPKKMQAYEKKIQDISRKIKFAFQDEQRGFGHAVYQANSFANNEPVLLLLGDTIYRSFTDAPCTKQLIDAYEVYGQTTVALQKILLEEVGNYGVFSGEWENKEETVIRINNIAEKPSMQYAKDYLTISSRSDPESCYGAFGCYVITKDVFDRLKTAIDNNIVNAKGEVELTEALEFVCKNSGIMGFIPEGRSFDLGNPESYRKTVAEF